MTAPRSREIDAKDGGPAFPVVGMDQRGGQQFFAVFNGGMSLRDYMAAAAMTGYLSAPGRDADHARQSPDDLAQWCYDQADAMLAARSK